MQGLVTGILGGCQKPDAAPRDGAEAVRVCVRVLREATSGRCQIGREKERTAKRETNEDAVEIDLDQQSKSAVPLLQCRCHRFCPIGSYIQPIARDCVRIWAAG